MPLNEHDAANFLSVQLIEFERRSAARIRTRISCECVSATYEDLTSGVIGYCLFLFNCVLDKYMKIYRVSQID